MSFVETNDGIFINLSLIEEFTFDAKAKRVTFSIGGKGSFGIDADSPEEFLQWIDEHKRDERRRMFEENKGEIVKAVIEAMSKGAFVEKSRPTLRIGKPNKK